MTRQAELEKLRRRIDGIELDEFPYTTTCTRDELSSVVGVNPDLTGTDLNRCIDHVAGTLDCTDFCVHFTEASLTSTTYTLAAVNAFGIGWNNLGESRTVVIPANAAVAFPIGTMVAFAKNYTNQLDIKGDTGVTLVGYITNTGALANSWARQTPGGGGCLLIKVATNTWYIFGRYTQGS